MKILKFKTNIGSKEQVDAIGEYLHETAGISKWQIDTESADKILSVSGEELEPDVVKSIAEKAGFKVEMIHVLAVGGGDV